MHILGPIGSGKYCDSAFAVISQLLLPCGGFCSHDLFLLSACCQLCTSAYSMLTNAWWNRCKTDLNSFLRRKLDETTGTSSYYMDENHSAGSKIQRPQYGRRSWLGSEPSTLEIDVYVRRYALLVVLARNDDDDDAYSKLMTWWRPAIGYLHHPVILWLLPCLCQQSINWK